MRARQRAMGGRSLLLQTRIAHSYVKSAMPFWQAFRISYMSAYPDGDWSCGTIYTFTCNSLQTAATQHALSLIIKKPPKRMQPSTALLQPRLSLTMKAKRLAGRTRPGLSFVLSLPGSILSMMKTRRKGRSHVVNLVFLPDYKRS